MNKVTWPEKHLRKEYKIEMCFSYTDEVEENRFMCCCGIVERVRTRDEKVIKWRKNEMKNLTRVVKVTKCKRYRKNISVILAH